MENSSNSLKERMSTLKDDELRRIIYVDNQDYQEEAIKIAKKELFSRYNKNIWESDRVSLLKLIKLSNVAEIEAAILKLYPDSIHELPKYRDLIIGLSQINVQENTETYITIEKTESEIPQEAWRIYGIDKSTNENFGVEYCKHEEWMSFMIIKEQLQKFGKEEYIAHCIMSMTSMGFDEEEVEQKFENIKNFNLENEDLDEYHTQKSYNRDLNRFAGNWRTLQRFLIIIFIGVPAIGALFLIYYLYFYAQEKTFLTNADYLLIPSSLVGWCFLYFGVLLVVVIIIAIHSSFNSDLGFDSILRICLTLGGFFSTGFFIAVVYLFFSYTVISPGGISYKQSLFQNEIHYDWKDVKAASIYIEYTSARGRNNIKLRYILSTSDDKQFDIKLSKQFWNKVIIIDDLLKKKNIKIFRSTSDMNSCYSMLLKESVDFSEGLEMLKKIMTVEE